MYKNDDFIEGWKTFLDNIEALAKIIENDLSQIGFNNGLIELLEDISKELKDKEILNAVIVLEKYDYKDDHLVHLMKEFTIFNTLMVGIKKGEKGTGINAGETRKESFEKTIETGKTIKGSFENLIKNLPERWKRRLKVLNDVLSLLKGVI